MLPDPYPVRPWTAPCQGEIRLPGSKSLTNRALVLAALSDGVVQLEGALFSRDTRILIDGLTALGFSVQANENQECITVAGQGGCIPKAAARLFVGNAGTAARFLTALVCLHPNGRFTFDGDEEMRKRPMAGLIESLEALGARFSFAGEPGCFPFEVKTAGLPVSDWQVDASASSQMLSALMMVAQPVSGTVKIKASGVRPAFVEMTAGLMRQFGSDIKGSPEEGYLVRGQASYRSPAAQVFQIEPDVSAASYFMILPAVTGGYLKLAGLRRDMLQGDLAFAGVLESIGMQVEEDSSGWLVRFAGFHSGSAREFNFETFSDTFLTLAAVAPLLPFPVRITGIGHTRHQETDRIRAMATELARLGARVGEEAAALGVDPFPAGFSPPIDPVTIQTYRDHRVAMSFAILACSSRFGSSPWLRIADPACCGKTFPGFFRELEKLYHISHDK
ncbi:MAG TPA: 3-phosphoshikimate 1-carboxyvinyltransferase [Oceanipulchritudo sp.]|nr:3-phosphoshikimate 1-carboxyvinyltransferase [Oceanipulchritudo sp.]